MRDRQKAQQIQNRPFWVRNDTHWNVFKDYRSGSRTQDLVVVYGLSRAQIQNIINRILERYFRPGSLSNKACDVLKNLGFDYRSETLLIDFLSEVGFWNSRYPQMSRTVESWLLQQKQCGNKTAEEILTYLNTLAGRDLRDAKGFQTQEMQSS